MLRFHRLIVAGIAAAVGVAATATAAPSPGPAPTTPTGWGSQPQAVGRYRLLVSQASVAPASRPPGVFAFAVDLISELTAAVDRASANTKTTTAGQLTVFMRKVKTGEPYAGSGILAIHLPDANYVLYLTELSSHADRRSAVINQGAFVGPPIGRLSGHSTAPGHLTITIHANGLLTLHARLVRFSASPTP